MLNINTERKSVSRGNRADAKKKKKKNKRKQESGFNICVRLCSKWPTAPPTDRIRVDCGVTSELRAFPVALLAEFLVFYGHVFQIGFQLSSFDSLS